MKTFRNFVLSGLFCLIIQSGYSQKVIPGISAGASLNYVNLKGIPDMTTDVGNVNGVEAGLYLTIASGSWYLRPAAVASFLKGTVSSNVDEAQPEESDFNLTTLEVPVIGGLRLVPGVTIEAGPSWNYLMHHTGEVDGVNLDLSRNNIGYRAGVRVTLNRFGVFGHYGGIISELDDSKYHLDRPSRIVFGATIDLGSNKK